MLKKGEIFFNGPQFYNNLYKFEKQTGDEFEGAEWINNNFILKLKYSHPIHGEGEFFPIKNQLSTLIQYNYFFLSSSFYAVTVDAFKESDTFKIDSKNAEFKGADSAILIREPYRFINSTIQQLKLSNRKYEAKLVSYKEIKDKGQIDMGPFVKKLGHKHQSEFRIIIESLDASSQMFHLGSIEDYCEIVTADEMINTIWKAKR